MEKTKIIIVGNGGVGAAATIQKLASQGHNIEVIERLPDDLKDSNTFKSSPHLFKAPMLPNRMKDTSKSKVNYYQVVVDCSTGHQYMKIETTTTKNKRVVVSYQCKNCGKPL